MKLTLLWIVLAPLLGAWIAGQDLPKPTATGAVALFGKRAVDWPKGNRFGTTRRGYRAHEGLRFEAREVADGLEVLASSVDEGLHTEYVRFFLTPAGARAEAYLWTDVGGPAWIDLAGIAVLLTDGTDSCLEFEVTCSGLSGEVAPYVGRIRVGDLGMPLASRFRPLSTEDAPERFHESRTNEIATEAGIALARGYLDGGQRRQGVWVLRDPTGQKRLETTWRDGRLLGLVTQFDEDGRRRVQEYQEGVQVGIEYTWHASGAVQAVRECTDGRPRGHWATFDESGEKIGEGESPIAPWHLASAPKEREAFRLELADFSTRQY